MAANVYFSAPTKEQLAAHYKAADFAAGVPVDFVDVVHEDYPRFWISPRAWMINDFLVPKAPYQHAVIYTKQALLDMLPQAIEYVKDPDNDIDEESLVSILKDFDRLKEKLDAFDETTHTIIGHEL